jgi:hypothetical protein
MSKAEIQIFLTTDSLGTLDLTERAESFRFGTLQPGGWWQAQVNVLAPERDLWMLVDAEEPGTLAFVANDDVIWRGDLAGLTLERNKLAISAEGPAMALKDDEVWRAFADSEYRRWKIIDSDKFDRDNNNRLYLAMRDSAAYDGAETARLTWPEEAVFTDRVKRLTAHVEIALERGQCEVGFRSGATTIWSAAAQGQTVYVRGTDYTIDISDPTKPALIAATGGAITEAQPLRVTYQHDVQTTETFQANLNIAVPLRATANSGSVEVWNEFSTVQYHAPGDFTMDEAANKLTILEPGVIADGQPLSVKYLVRTTATDELVHANKGVWAKLAYVPVVDSETVRADGESTVTYDIDVAVDVSGLEFYLRPTTPNGKGNAKATQVCVRTIDPSTNQAIISEILAANGIAEADVRETNLVIDQAVYEGRPGTDVIKDLAFLGDGVESWVCVIYGDGAELRPWSAQSDWMLTRADLASWSIERNRSNVANAVRAKLPDKWISEWFEDRASIARYRRREKTLPLPQTSQAEARRWAQIYLAENANVLSSLRIAAGHLIRKPDNSLWPAVMIRAGDVISLRDLIPDQDLLIRVSETQFNGATMQIVPVGASSRLEVILSKLKVT